MSDWFNDSNPAVWWRRFLVVLGAAWALRIVLACATDLTPDEAYYWALSVRPQASYYDHPPLVAYVILFMRTLLGEVPIAVRLPALLAYPFVSWAIFELGRRGLRSGAAGFWGSVMLHLTPAGTALGFITTPDVPLAFCWAVAGVALLRIAHGAPLPTGPETTSATSATTSGSESQPDTAVGPWLLLGVALGLGAMGKYNMIFFCPAVALLTLGWRSRQAWLGTGRFWLMVGLAALGALPVVYWNSINDWISFRFQFAHGLTPAQRGLGVNVGEFLGGQLGTLGLTLFPLVAFVSLRQFVVAWRENRPQEFVLAAMTVPSLLFFAYSGMRSKVEANWPQVAYLSALPLVAAWALQRQRPRRALLIAMLPSALLAGLATFQALTFVVPLPPGFDISRRLTGWRELGEAVRTVDVALGRKAVFCVQGAPLTALVGFYGGVDLDRLAELNGHGQFGLWWRGRAVATGTDVVIVDENESPERDAKTPMFARRDPVQTLATDRAGRRLHVFNLAPFRDCIRSFSPAMPERPWAVPGWK